MMDSWRVIGLFGSCESSDVPEIMPAAVLEPSEDLVVVSYLAETEEALWQEQSMTRDDFQRCVVLGSAVSLPWVIWEPGAVLLLVSGKLERVSVWEAEVRLRQFVEACRYESERALERGDLNAALESVDRARRVSNEPVDIRQVIALSPEVEVQEMFSRQLDWMEG